MSEDAFLPQEGAVTEASRPRTPASLAARGKRFWVATVEEYELNAAGLALLEECARLLDEIDGMRAAVKRDGATVTGSRKQPRPHPLLGEIRQARLTLARMLKVLDLPDDEAEQPGPRPHPAVTAKAQRAAEKRWRPHVVNGGA
jgi:hypothetical protein